MQATADDRIAVSCASGAAFRVARRLAYIAAAGFGLWLLTLLMHAPSASAQPAPLPLGSHSSTGQPGGAVAPGDAIGAVTTAGARTDVAVGLSPAVRVAHVDGTTRAAQHSTHATDASTGPVGGTVVHPVVATVASVVRPVVTAVVPPVVRKVVQPVVTAAVRPVVAEVVHPVVAAVVRPAMDAVVHPVVDELAEHASHVVPTNLPRLADTALPLLAGPPQTVPPTDGLAPSARIVPASTSKRLPAQAIVPAALPTVPTLQSRQAGAVSWSTGAAARSHTSSVTDAARLAQPGPTRVPLPAPAPEGVGGGGGGSASAGATAQPIALNGTTVAVPSMTEVGAAAAALQVRVVDEAEPPNTPD